MDAVQHDALPAKRAVSVIGVASALGAPAELAERGPADGPQGLRERGLLAALAKAEIAAEWSAMIEPPFHPPANASLAVRLSAVAAMLERVASEVARVCNAGRMPLVLGGDHAIAAGTWRGVMRAAGGPVGLLWIDAHLDSHTTETTWSGNIHGMPLAALLGVGAPPLVDRGPMLDPARVCVLGARSWEPAELSCLHRLGVRIFDMPEIHRRGLPAVFAEALAIVRARGNGFGVSLDLDSLDPEALPATTCPVAFGLEPPALREALAGLAGVPDLRALEIVEYVPARDPDGRSAAWVVELACAALAAR